MKNFRTFTISLLVISFSLFSCEDDIVDEPIAVNHNFLLQTEYEWTSIESFTNNAVTVFRDSIVSIGGFTLGNHGQDEHTGDAHSYKNDGSWVEREQRLPAFWNKEAVVLNDRLFVLGQTVFEGFNSQNVIFYTDDMENWDYYDTNLPIFQFASTTVWNNQLLIVGLPIFGSDQHQAWTSTDGETWQNIATNLPLMKQGQLIAYNNQLVWIGGTDDVGMNINEIWTSSNGQNWTQVMSNAPEIFGHKLEVYNNKLFIVGGKTNEDKTGIWYTSNLSDWENAFPNGNDEEYIVGHSTAVYQDKIYILGGYRFDSYTGNLNASGEITTLIEL